MTAYYVQEENALVTQWGVLKYLPAILAERELSGSIPRYTVMEWMGTDDHEVLGCGPSVAPGARLRRCTQRSNQCGGDLFNAVRVHRTRPHAPAV
jgi:hypothetical protein